MAWAAPLNNGIMPGGAPPLKILHTGDWHLGDRLGRIDRTADLRRAVERIAGYCANEDVDVLLIAGDLFSERCGPDGLRGAVEHLRATFGPFLRGGGTIVALTGNHDHEGFCRTLRHAFDLAAPVAPEPGSLLASGRLHLATEPTFFRLADRDGLEVQFVLMPYPTPSVYLDGEARFVGVAERNRALHVAYARRLEAIGADPGFRRDRVSVLAAHIHMQGAQLPSPFRMSEAESIVVADDLIQENWAYVALGHVHQPQALLGRPHVRYCGSIERLDLGERDDQKECVLVTIGPLGLVDRPRSLPLEARPIERIVIADPRADLPGLIERRAELAEALVVLELTYTPGRDDLDGLIAQLEDLAPHWYKRDCRGSDEADGVDRPVPEDSRGEGLYETVIHYLEAQLEGAPDRAEILALAESFLAEEEPR